MTECKRVIDGSDGLNVGLDLHAPVPLPGLLECSDQVRLSGPNGGRLVSRGREAICSHYNDPHSLGLIYSASSSLLVKRRKPPFHLDSLHSPRNRPCPLPTCVH
ncbi:unnamed protein product [Pleuronectes platessa]|uniref:Uncharacterized protein n=1 Tax=Pleuronectes platessa TaxID=8262 RepID=A0A9N7UYP3_PLEPL|nr:unnamed protein product [Pleuronectes platessa]